MRNADDSTCGLVRLYQALAIGIEVLRQENRPYAS